MNWKAFWQVVAVWVGLLIFVTIVIVLPSMGIFWPGMTLVGVGFGVILVGASMAMYNSFRK